MMQRLAFIVVTVAAVTLGLSLAAPGASGPASAAGPAPVIHARPAIYRLVGRRWESTKVLRVGDRARIVLMFRMHGWDFLSAHVVMRKGSVPAKDGRIEFETPMRRTHAAKGFTRFWGNLRITPQLLGQQTATFTVSNGTGRVGATFSFDVKPKDASGL